MNCENSEKHVPSTVSASLEARLAPYSTCRIEPAVTAAEPPTAATAAPERKRAGRLVDDLKLLFASLGAGNSVVPMGDNSQAAKLLAEYARSLRTQ